MNAGENEWKFRTTYSAMNERCVLEKDRYDEISRTWAESFQPAAAAVVKLRL